MIYYSLFSYYFCLRVAYLY